MLKKSLVQFDTPMHDRVHQVEKLGQVLQTDYTSILRYLLLVCLLIATF